MARKVDIVISAKDNYSDAVTKMQKIQRSFTSDLEGLNKKLNTLNNSKVTLKTDLTKAKGELDAAKKAMKALGDEQSTLNYIAAQSNYDQIADNLKLVEEQAKDTRKSIKDLTGELSKAESRTGGSGGSGGGSGGDGTLAALSKAGLTNMLGGSVANLGGTLVSSALGSEAGSIVTGVASGAATGAAMGAIAGPVGMAVGGLVGAISGAIDAATDTFKARDEAFKSVVSEKYSQYQQEFATSLSSGSAIAGARETSLQSFTTLFGSKDTAEGFLDELKNMANVTPFLYDDLTGMAKTLKTYGYEVEDILPTIQKIGDAGAALGMGKDDMVNIATYLGRMQTTGKTTMEYLNPIMERGIPVFDYLAESLGVSAAEVQEMISKGLLPGAEAAEIIANAMGDNFAGAMEEQAKTFEGMSSTLQGMEEEMDAALGEGYNEERKKGMEEQIAWYQGEGGKALQEANRLIGVWEASLENKKEQMMRESIESTMKSAEFEAATEAEKGALLQAAKAKAEADYATSEGYETQLAAQEQLVGMLGDALEPAYENLGYRLSLALSKGLADANADIWGSADLEGRMGILSESLAGAYGSGKAFGMERVPYDNFPALLHEGERVLTAAQAREADRGGGGVVISGNQFVVREEADIDKIAAALYHQMESASQSYVGG